MREVYAQVDLGAIEDNLREIRRKISGGARLCVVVKANGYGHGAIEVARVAEKVGAEYLAVATVEEGVELREAGIKEPILILGLSPREAAEEIVERELTQTIAEVELAKALSKEAVKLGKPVKVHLKIETGMGRIGVKAEGAADLAEEVTRLKGLELEGVFSHFAMADEKDKTFTREQIREFKRAIREIEERGIRIKIRHIAESAAIMELPQAHLDMVRAGIITYGLYPSEEVERTIKLKPAMKLKARIVFIKRVREGTTIGYGREYKAERESVIATLPLGYADGYIRAYKGFYAEVRGKRAPIAGRVCMDQVMIDVTGIEGVQVGDEVTLFGSETLTIDEAAKHIGTINYEVTCLVRGRVPRRYES